MKQLTFLCLLLSAFLYSAAATAARDAQEWYCVYNQTDGTAIVTMYKYVLLSGDRQSFPLTNKDGWDAVEVKLLENGNVKYDKTIYVTDDTLATVTSKDVTVGGYAKIKCNPPAA
jgi:hypothetical protein